MIFASPSSKQTVPNVPPPTPQQAAQQIAAGQGVPITLPITTTMVSAVETLFFEGNASRTTARTDDELVADTISCPKGDRDALKKADKKGYAKLKEMSSAHLKDTTFELVKPFDTKMDR